jgi:hypothetical protein
MTAPEHLSPLKSEDEQDFMQPTYLVYTYPSLQTGVTEIGSQIPYFGLHFWLAAQAVLTQTSAH